MTVEGESDSMVARHSINTARVSGRPNEKWKRWSRAFGVVAAGVGRLHRVQDQLAQPGLGLGQRRSLPFPAFGWDGRQNEHGCRSQLMSRLGTSTLNQLQHFWETELAFELLDFAIHLYTVFTLPVA